MNIGDLVQVKMPAGLASSGFSHPWMNRHILIIDIEHKHSGCSYICLYDNEKRIFSSRWLTPISP